MGLPRFACVAIAAFSLLPGFNMTGFADSPQDKSITLAEQGSFFVGGRIVQDRWALGKGADAAQGGDQKRAKNRSVAV